MAALTVKNVGKAYKRYAGKWRRVLEWFSGKSMHEKKWVLQNIDFKISPGEAVGIVGVNGAGKSTLLKIITGTTQPTEGEVSIQGRVAALLELGMGFHPDFTGRQNAYMAGQLLGLKAEEISACMAEIEEFAEIGDYIDRPVRMYSSGMQVRLAFSVATAVRPDILIVDEALSVGDAYFQAKCFQRIADFKTKGTTLLLVSHSADDVVKHCERAILLKDGMIAHDGLSRDVTNRYLDELFGKKRKLKKNKPSNSNDSTNHELFSIDGLDEFHTRPNYRPEEHRWGHGGASIIDYLIVSNDEKYPSRIEGNSVVDFYFKVRFDSDHACIVPGFLIKTLEGIFLYGTNSFISGNEQARVSVNTGDVRVFRFSMPLSLNQGHYLISFGVSSGHPAEELLPLDRRYDSVLIHVSRSMQFWGVVDLQASFQSFESPMSIAVNV